MQEDFLSSILTGKGCLSSRSEGGLVTFWPDSQGWLQEHREIKLRKGWTTVKVTHTSLDQQISIVKFLSCNLLTILKTQLKISSISLALDRKTKFLVDYPWLSEELALFVLGATAKHSGTQSWDAQSQPPAYQCSSLHVATGRARSALSPGFSPSVQ